MQKQPLNNSIQEKWLIHIDMNEYNVVSNGSVYQREIQNFKINLYQINNAIQICL